MILRLLFSLGLLTIGGALFAQSLFIPRQMSDSRRGKETQEQMVFYAYPYTSNTIDLRDFKKRHPNLEAPDQIELDLTDLSSAFRMTALIGLIDGVAPTEDAVVIWLAANYRSNEVTFFIDYDLDRKFNLAEDILILRSKDPVQELTITPANPDIPQQKFSLKVPPKRKRKSSISKPNYKILSQFAIGAFAGAGISSLEYEYDNLEKGYPSWYSINFTEKNVGLSLSYNTFPLRFAISGNYQNIYSYTSYLNIQFDKPKVVFDPTTGRQTVIDNVEVNRNFDRHPTHRFQYAATIGLRLHTRVAEFQPFFSVGQTSYSPGTYVGNRYDDGNDYRLPASNFFETGLRFEFAVGPYRALHLDLAYLRSQWRPEGYFEAVPHENLKIKYQMWRLRIGYRLGL